MEIELRNFERPVALWGRRSRTRVLSVAKVGRGMKTILEAQDWRNMKYGADEHLDQMTASPFLILDVIFVSRSFVRRASCACSVVDFQYSFSF